MYCYDDGLKGAEEAGGAFLNMRDTITEIYWKMQEIFTSSDMMIFGIVLAMIGLLPVMLVGFRRRGSVRTVSLAVFAVYILGNLSFTLLNREVLSDQYIVLQPLSDLKGAFYLDLGVIGTLRRLLDEGVEPVLQTIHINRSLMAREVLLNVLLYVPMGYLLPFVFRSLRGKLTAITLIGFLCSCATEIAQLYWHIGCFQVDDIICNTAGTLLGAFAGSLLGFIWRVK